MSTRVHILMFDQVEVLDFAGPYEVFTTASRVHARSHADMPALFTVACVSRDGQRVQARAGLRGWVDNGRLITSAGISAGIDMSLHLVARLGGQQLAERTARQMDYPWQAHV